MINNGLRGNFAYDSHVHMCYYNYNMLMKKKNSYAAPACDAVEMRVEGVICQSIVEGAIPSPGYDDGGNLPF